LPIPSNQRVNAYLKELADICGITTKITFHIARHTFATTVTLENGVPIDSVSKMLGHRSIKATQIYAKVSDKKISDDTENCLQNFRESITKKQGKMFQRIISDNVAIKGRVDTPV